MADAPAAAGNALGISEPPFEKPSGIVPASNLPALVVRFQRLLLLVIAGWLVLEAVARSGWVRHAESPLYLAYYHLGSAPFTETALASILVFFLFSAPSRREMRTVIGLGLTLSLVLWLILPGLMAARPFSYQAQFAGVMAFASSGPLHTLPVLFLTPEKPATLLFSNCLCFGMGLAALAQLLHRAWTTTGMERTKALALLFPGLIMLLLANLTLFFLGMLIPYTPNTYDALLYAADATFGFQPSFVLGQLFSQCQPLALFADLIYRTVPLPAYILLAYEVRENSPTRFDILGPIVLIGATGFFLYVLFPAVGPRFVFADTFPHAPPPAHAVLETPPLIPNEPRNCMPSLHTAWVLLYWWHSRPLPRWVRIVMGTYLVFTMLATLGFGLHYFVDLVVAFPFTLVVHALCLPNLPGVARQRWSCVLLGTALTVAWLLVLRFRLDWLEWSPVLTGAAALLTMVGIVIVERRLYRDVSRATPLGAELVAAPANAAISPVPAS